MFKSVRGVPMISKWMSQIFSGIERKCVREKKIFAILTSFNFNCYTENVCVFIQ